MLQIVMLDNEENFLQFLDPELCTLVENHEKGGLRTLDLEYKFQDLHSDKQLFRIGNKVWVSGDTNLTDTLYVINTPVETDVYKENSFHCDLEEVLVELNYAPLFSQLDLKSSNGFKLTTTNGEQSVTINWNALNYWFGDYFNIGVVQKCLNETHNKVALNGTMTLMSLLRYIEEETGNIFVTRYEKDIITNTIHRYLDFLNPINVSKDWVLNVEYDFVEPDDDTGVFDENGDPSTDEDEYADTESEDDLVDFTTNAPVYTNLDPDDIEFRIVNKDMELLNSDGLVYTEEESETPLSWESTDIGFDDTLKHINFELSCVQGDVGLTCNNRSFIILATEEIGTSYGRGYVDDNDYNTPSSKGVCVIPDDSYFTLYDTSTDKTIYRVQINREIGTVHEEVLDFGFNIENIVFELDESETFTAISPVMSLDNMDGLNKNDLSTILQYWKNLEVEKGTPMPMIMEKVTVQCSSAPYTLAHAREELGTRSWTNYYSRPYHPNDNIDTDTPANSSWEFWRATAYWNAPFDKHSGDLFINADNTGDTQYLGINARPDTRESREIYRPKIGTVESSEETVFGIYNDVAMALKDKMTPKFDIKVDVANLRRGQFNQYQLHDKVYVKLPDYSELVTARVTKTTKEAHDVAKNTITLDNYSINTIKNVQQNVYIEASNASFKYPKAKNLTVRLINEDYDNTDPYSVHYPANQLLSFVLYKVNNDSRTLTKNVYTKRTNANGYATINMQYDPGDYELEISYPGNEEYNETSLTLDINVSGSKSVGTNTLKTKPKDLTKSKTVKKNTKNKKQVKRYYTKYGVSPDEKYIMAVGRPSASGELSKYGYKFYKTVFVRKCPFCGSRELYWNIFWTGNEHTSTGTNPAVGLRKSGSAEGEITCKHCDADFSIFGKDKATVARKNLTVHKKAVRCKKTEAYTLKKGKMYYDTIYETIKSKKVTSTKGRHTSYTIPAALVKQAYAIVGDSTGLDAAKKIAKWCGTKKKFKYKEYPDFKRSASTALKKRSANCCDSTRLMLTLMEAAGCSEHLKLQYVHCHNSTYNKGHVFAKITTRSSGKSRYVDPCCKLENGRNPWGHHLRGYGPIVDIKDYNGPSNSPF